MGCGISRFDPRHHHHGLHRRNPSTNSIGDNDHSDINITKNGSRLLFFAYHGEDDGRRSISSPLSPIHLKNITQMESPVMTQGNVGRRKAETCCDVACERNPDLERKSDTKLYINNHGADEDVDPRLSTCNLEDHNSNGGASPLFMGSPSFREYCFVSADDDNLKSPSHINGIGNNNSNEREARMRKSDDIRASDEGSAGSSGSIAGVKKTRGARKLRKSASPNHRAGAVRRSLMNVASCYHPPNHHHNTLPSPPTNTDCICKLPQH